jgi:tripartite-type tricarboxylate transporter receptor subunit TctC
MIRSFKAGVRLVGLIGAAAVTLGAYGAGYAQSLPADKAMKIVVPYPPGGSADPVTRLIANHLGPLLDRKVVVENVPGASGNIGTNQVVRAAPDGLTLVLAATPLSTNPSFYDNIPFNVLTDLAPITMITLQQFVLVVHPSVSAQSVPELIALAKASPGKLTFASHSAGGATHLAAELFKVMAGIDLVHVPYKGQAPAVADLVAGHVSMLFDSASTAMTHAASGRLRALATTGPVRSTLVADGKLPVMAEHKGLDGFNVIAWYGYMAPAGTPGPILESLAKAINTVLKIPEVTQRLNSLGFDVVGTSPGQFKQHVQTEVEKWSRVVKASGAKL